MILGCGKCRSINGGLLLLLGLVFLAVDLGWWGFWGISWWSALFVLVGFCMLCQMKCGDCMALCCPPSGSGKKK